MITRRLSIILGVTTATVGVALLAPVSGSMARGGGSGSSTYGSFPTGPNQNLNGGNSSSGSSGSGSTHGPFPQDRTRMQTEVIPRRGRAVGAAGTEAMACLQAPAPEAAANPPTAGGRAGRANDHCSKFVATKVHKSTAALSPMTKNSRYVGR